MEGTALSHRLDRAVVIRASPEVVFRFFTDSARWASWWGAGSTIDPRPGGSVMIRLPGGVEVTGEVIEIEVPRRLVFTYGFVSGSPIPPGGSIVAIDLAREGADTRLTLAHTFAEAAPRDAFVQGWRHQLALFANAVSNEVNSAAAETIDAWFGAWAEPDAAARTRTLDRIAVPQLTFRDRYGHTDGAADLIPHIDAALRFMPGIRMQREGDIRHCQGVALADWIARSPDGQERARGTNVFVFDAEGRIESVTGLWG
jgi:uncharacterized protein YndB with AHSA1/START domain